MVQKDSSYGARCPPNKGHGLRGLCLVDVWRLFRRPAHPADQGWGAPPGIDERLAGRDVVLEIRFMHAAERPQEGAQRGACPFTGVAVNLSHPIAIVIADLLVLAMVDRGMRNLQAVVTAVLIRIDNRRVGRDGFGQNALTGGFVTVTDHLAPLFAGVTADDMNDRWPVVVVGPMARLFIGAAAGRVVRVAMGRRCRPLHSGKVHPPRTSGPPSHWLGRYRSDSFGAAAAGYGPFGARVGVRGPSARSIHPW
jgi:hypothetical protein